MSQVSDKACHVTALFEAAAHFYRMRPWQFVTDADLLSIPNPRPGEPPLSVSVMGAGGISRGLAIFDSEADFERTAADEGQTNLVYGAFERLDQVPHIVAAEAQQQGWIVANKSAFPIVVRVQKEEPVPCRGDDLRRVAFAFRHVGEMASAYRQVRAGRRKQVPRLAAGNASPAPERRRPSPTARPLKPCGHRSRIPSRKTTAAGEVRSDAGDSDRRDAK